MSQFWTIASLEGIVGATLFLGAAGILYLGYRFGPHSTTAVQRWKVSSFVIAAFLVTAECLELLTSSGSAGIGFAMVPLMFSTCADGKYLRKPAMLTACCLGFTVMFMICEHLPDLEYGPAQRVIHHPGFVVPLWVFLLWQLLRLWRLEKGKSIV